jgi:predicted RNA-binding Zn ribbon-like protein
MADSERHAGNLKLVGGRLCLDFANTVDWRTREQPHEWLASYADLVAWSQHAGIVSEQRAHDLREQAVRHPAAAAAVLQQAIALREAMYGIFAAVAGKGTPETADVATLNRVLGGTMSRLQLTFNTDGFTWSWDGEQTSLDQMLWPVIRSAAELLISGDLDRVGTCAAEGCGWLFFDTSRNHSRRWCTMEDCGNRAKARRYYQKNR